MSHESSVPHGTQPPSRDRVADTLRDRILSGDLPPGARLPTQHELAEEFGTNRTAVRQALDLLRHEGLLTGTGRGAPPRVAERAPAHEAPRKADIELADRLLHAFRTEHVTVDVFSLTTETLNTALAPSMIAISREELRPRSITVRVLLPSVSADLALPRLVSDPGRTDPRPLERLHELTHTYAGALRGHLETLKVRGLVPEVSMEFRSVPITPTHKLYLLNGTEALFGYYHVVPHRVGYRGEEMEIHDVLGLGTQLFRHIRSDDSQDEHDTAFVDSSKRWFDSLWESIAQPFEPA
ncbi:GntR family transcriptional regulator [Streptomyces carminius]|uniref:GntR family transcriptional regulator n=1 Tax=Streptomyces carminius TaxID=2665496 RepID=A0A2M8LZX7_9ACTN|nr:winged helix-turn-helix domain-containing protein [Streptomyces carminius]PJE97517.1 GntR family transcriptional regulator [Streptomyces carminius]